MRGKHVDGRYPVVVLVAGGVQWRYQSLDVLYAESRLGADAVLGEELIERGSQKLAVNEEIRVATVSRFRAVD